MTICLSNKEILKHEQTVRATVNRLLLSRRLSDIQIEREDLYQIGWITLLYCLKRFDKNRGVKFETYLARAIYHAINAEFNKLYKIKMDNINWDVRDEHEDDMSSIVDIIENSGKFTQQEQDVFWARFLHNNSYRQIEKNTNICRKKARKMYDEILDKIKEMLTYE